MANNADSRYSPFVIAAFVWTFALVGIGIGIAEWRFRLSYEVPAVVKQGDKGFRYHLSRRKCINSEGVEGYSENHFGPCGLVRDLKLRRAKVENHIMIAGTLVNSDLKNVIFDWVTAHGMRWNDIGFQEGKIWDSEFPLAEFRGVKFVNIDFRGVSFSDAKFIDCQFINSRLLDTSFRGAVFIGSAFIGTTCSSCDFSAAKFEESTIDLPFENAIFNLKTVLPFPVEQIDRFGFKFRE